MKIRTGLLFLMAGAFIGLSTASSHAVLAPLDGGTVVFFNSQFNNDIIPRKWKQKKGEWDIVKNKAGENDYLASTGLPDISSSIVFAETFTDFVFTVRMSRRSSVNDKSSRIIVRAKGPLMEDGHFEDEYDFNISREGRFSVFKFVSGNEIRLKKWTRTGAIKRGSHFNELSVTAKGEELSFRINGVLVWQDTDSSLEKGRVGIGFYNHPDSTDNDLRVDWAILETFVDEPSQAADGLDETTMDPNDDQIQLDGGNADGSP